jgi:hypothetical protein
VAPLEIPYTFDVPAARAAQYVAAGQVKNHSTRARPMRGDASQLSDLSRLLGPGIGFAQ